MRAGPVPVVVVLVTAAAVAAGFSTLDLRRSDRELPGVILVPTSAPPAVPPEPAATPAAQSGEGWSGLGELVLGLLLVIGLAAAGWAGWLLLRRVRRTGAGSWYRLRSLGTTAGRQSGTLDSERLLAAVDEAVARSEDDPDPRRAVIACWVRLAEAADAAGIPRHGSDTATDLVVRLLRGHRVSEPVLGAFVEAYWLARYATHAVDERMRTQARSALRRLRAEISQEVGAS